MVIPHSLFLLFVGGCPPPGLRLYDQATGWLLKTEVLPVSPATAFAFDLDGLLAEGSYTLGVSAVNVYGCESEVETIGVEIGSGGEVDQGMIQPTSVYAEVLAAGEVAIGWDAIEDLTSDTNQLKPTEFEVAEAGDLATVLAAVGFVSTRQHRAELGPYANGASVTLAVRSSDGVAAGVRGEWVLASAVVADSVGPAVPDIDEASLPGGCGCS